MRNENEIEAVQDKIELNLKDAALWLGGWDKVLELITVLRDNEEEAAFDRANND